MPRLRVPERGSAPWSLCERRVSEQELGSHVRTPASFFSVFREHAPAEGGPEGKSFRKKKEKGGGGRSHSQVWLAAKPRSGVSPLSGRQRKRGPRRPSAGKRASRGSSVGRKRGGNPLPLPRSQGRAGLKPGAAEGRAASQPDDTFLGRASLCSAYRRRLSHRPRFVGAEAQKQKLGRSCWHAAEEAGHLPGPKRRPPLPPSRSTASAVALLGMRARDARRTSALACLPNEPRSEKSPPRTAASKHSRRAFCGTVLCLSRLMTGHARTQFMGLPQELRPATNTCILR
ncbi:hypothetical protein HPB50_012860 [Hyalomma asiaticum]|uniref:Uncharacterized protein n=1 Tax=Hyalomma asiaticum TaxID=266040 RepID=A0ACB7TJE4_HYAAI|nr:hypothetical protein HPB50_012860 [Hyalomma asiaticum]